MSTIELDFGVPWTRKWLRYHKYDDTEVAVVGAEHATQYESAEKAYDAARRFMEDHPGLVRFRLHQGDAVWAWVIMEGGSRRNFPSVWERLLVDQGDG